MSGLILASTSAVRQSLLRGAGLVFEAVGSGVDEAGPKAELLDEGASPRRVAEVLAALKATAVSSMRPGLVIGADQTLEFEGALFDKADNLAEARERLLALRGQAHHLHSALVLARDGEPVWSIHETATLRMRDFSEAFLDAYLAECGEAALSSVGCYQLEGPGIQLFDRIEGDYFAILGLPLLPLLAYLRDTGEARS